MEFSSFYGSFTDYSEFLDDQSYWSVNAVLFITIKDLFELTNASSVRQQSQNKKTVYYWGRDDLVP